ncbi:glycosyltransferase family 2 protein [Salinigranum halophilum]|uniref:glycosyltransferase family 2 protein n=1 Tax=Salinigranum halophilum TaxID=2565931 RepID=UPI001375EC98|nr:glycosyltransferase family 2 protein [Salinigranum halophilum]
MALVSVIIPTYHRSSYLPGAIQTALGQTHDEVEVIVVNDDASDTATLNALAEYTDDSRVTAINNTERRGISASRNQAVAHADGEYLCILDDDDRWRADKIEQQLTRFNQLSSEYAVVYTGGEIWSTGEPRRVLKQFSPPESRIGEIYPEVLSSWGMSPHSGHMIRTDAFRAVGGFDETMNHGEDWDLSIRLAKRYKFDAVDEPLTIRLSHDENVSSKRAHANQRKDILAKYPAPILNDESIGSEFFSKWHAERGYHQLENGKHVAAIRDLWIALGYKPTTQRAVLFVISLFGPRVFSSLSDLSRWWRTVMANRTSNQPRV